jgi:hypothetical protein
MHPLSCCLSAAAICFLSRPVPPRDSALLPTGRRSFLPDHDGFSTFRTSELHPVPGASSAPKPWCSPGWRADASQHCRITAAGSQPQKPFHRQGSALRGFIQRFTVFALPDFASPVASGWITGSRASSRSFTPHGADSPRRMPGAGTGIEHSPGTNRQSYGPPIGQFTRNVRPRVAAAEADVSQSRKSCMVIQL